MITTQLHPALNTPIDDSIDGIQVDHNRIIADLVESNFNLVGIARDHKLKLTQLIAWAAQPAVRALLEAANELARCISDFKALQARAGAIETLVRHATGLWETPRDRDLASRAARTIVRITAPAKPARHRNRTASIPDAGAREAGDDPLPRAGVARPPSPPPERGAGNGTSLQSVLVGPTQCIEPPTPAANLHAASGTIGTRLTTHSSMNSNGHHCAAGGLPGP